MKKIMFLGTASSVGKSTVATAFCRYFTNKGLKVAPFKALNISLNSYVTEEGLEMGRAQVVQAEACEIKPLAYMNPILLKPSGDMKTQVIVNGKVWRNIDSYKYKEINKKLREVVKQTFVAFSKDYDLVVLEGSGSCAEINLKDTDIANMEMAKVADSDVILVADIDRGGVFASIVGTIMLLEEEERARVKGVIINKFRGNMESFKPAMKQLEDIIKIPVLGALPYAELDIDDEDSVTEKFKNKKSKGIDVVIIKLPYISNFTDFNAIDRLDGVSIRYVTKVEELDNPDIIILPGSKNTIFDLRAIKENGFFDAITELKNSGTTIFGICGGYQMLGKSVNDVDGIEGEITSEAGFGFLDIDTLFEEEKVTRQTEGVIVFEGIEKCNGLKVKGYEIHNGISKINVAHEFIKVNDEVIGVCDEDGKVFGTYLHGIFDEGEFLQNFINDIKNKKGLNIQNNNEEENKMSYKEYKLQQYDKLAKILEENIDMEMVNSILSLSKN